MKARFVMLWMIRKLYAWWWRRYIKITEVNLDVSTEIESSATCGDEFFVVV